MAELVQANDGLQAKNEELRVISQQLWQTAKLATMGELAASIAHELNNPLTTVTLRVESLLRQAPPGDPKRNVLKVMSRKSADGRPGRQPVTVQPHHTTNFHAR